MPKPIVVRSGVSKKLAIASPKMQMVVSWPDQMTLKMHTHLIKFISATTVPKYVRIEVTKNLESINTH